MDLIMFPGDASFLPFEKEGPNRKPLVNGRIFVLRFSSSSARHFFWLQSKSQHSSGDPSFFSDRDRKLGEIVNSILQGEDIDVQQEIENLPSGGGDDDTAMEDADGGAFQSDHHRAASGGAGAGATGGDIREEGEESREGGADGGRA
jgi:26S proteasome regulatory subunit N13